MSDTDSEQATTPDNAPKHTASTDKEAQHADPKDKLYRLTYGDGLQLEVRPNGKKYWIHRYINPTTKKQTVYTIGRLPHWMRSTSCKLSASRKGRAH